jgi:hypothetical protein
MLHAGWMWMALLVGGVSFGSSAAGQGLSRDRNPIEPERDVVTVPAVDEACLPPLVSAEREVSYGPTLKPRNDVGRAGKATGSAAARQRCDDLAAGVGAAGVERAEAQCEVR